ncbi:MAG TPA: serine/threonine-protein kinase [Thermoanaerobaculia bacterium]
MLSAGSRLGPYEIVAPLGAGGMGQVYRARDSRLGREVALKVLPEEVASDSSRLHRFEKEARSASALNHPSIVTVYEIGKERAVSYIAMELVDGTTLREMLGEGALPVRRLLQIADGLARAHASGIVHRDLKPENLMVTKEGFAKILDFGLAKLTQAEPESGQETKAPTISAGTEPGVVMGTVGYMSPEQARGRSIDFRSDQFSLGSVLYEMATGKRAFTGESKPEILAAIIREEPEPIGPVNPKVPAPLRWIVERCLAKDPGERYASTQDLAREIATIRDRLSEASSAVEALPVAPRRRSRLPAPLLLAAVAAALAATFFLGNRVGKKPSASPPSFQRLTFRRGTISNARFAPDGQTIVFSAAGTGSPRRYSRRAGRVLKRGRSDSRIPSCFRSRAPESWHSRGAFRRARRPWRAYRWGAALPATCSRTSNPLTGLRTAAPSRSRGTCPRSIASSSRSEKCSMSRGRSSPTSESLPGELSWHSSSIQGTDPAARSQSWISRAGRDLSQATSPYGVLRGHRRATSCGSRRTRARRPMRSRPSRCPASDGSSRAPRSA